MNEEETKKIIQDELRKTGGVVPRHVHNGSDAPVLGGASYAGKGVVQFLTDAATSGITIVSGIANVNTGTSANKIVKLDSSGKLPAVDGSQLTNLPISDYQQFTADGTWTKPSGTDSGSLVYVQMWGGGGGGGGRSNGGGGTSGGGGGGGGGYVEGWFLASALSATQAVTVGAGGTGSTVGGGGGIQPSQTLLRMVGEEVLGQTKLVEGAVEEVVGQQVRGQQLQEQVEPMEGIFLAEQEGQPVPMEATLVLAVEEGVDRVPRLVGIRFTAVEEVVVVENKQLMVGRGVRLFKAVEGEGVVDKQAVQAGLLKSEEVPVGRGKPIIPQ